MRDVEAFRADLAIRESLRTIVSERFLAFLGLAIEGGRVVEGPDFAAKADVWRYPNHNWLRITRVLASTRMLGLEAESGALLDFLRSLRDGGTSRIDAGTCSSSGNGRSRADRSERSTVLPRSDSDFLDVDGDGRTEFPRTTWR